MVPTRLYGKPVRALLEAQLDIKAMSHITGGGLPGNLPRVLPDGFGMRLDLGSFVRPKIFDVLARARSDRGARAAAHVQRRPRVRRLRRRRPTVHARSRLLREAGEDPRVVGEIITVDASVEFEDRVQFGGGPRSNTFGAAG